jgi:dihydrofolate reductase
MGTKQMKIILVAAIGKERQLGLNNELLWKLPGDLPRFKEMTLGSPIIMGRKTYDSIVRPLPGRKNIVISRDSSIKIDGVSVASSNKEAVEQAETGASEKEPIENVFVIGGGEIYALFLPVSDALELTLVNDSPHADAFFPDFSGQKFHEISRQSNQAENLSYDYVRYERSSTNTTDSRS